MLFLLRIFDRINIFLMLRSPDKKKPNNETSKKDGEPGMEEAIGLCNAVSCMHLFLW